VCSRALCPASVTACGQRAGGPIRVLERNPAEPCRRWVAPLVCARERRSPCVHAQGPCPRYAHERRHPGRPSPGQDPLPSSSGEGAFPTPSRCFVQYVHNVRFVQGGCPISGFDSKGWTAEFRQSARPAPVGASSTDRSTIGSNSVQLSLLTFRQPVLDESFVRVALGVISRHSTDSHANGGNGN
jgi:hypothetical protein